MLQLKRTSVSETHYCKLCHHHQKFCTFHCGLTIENRWLCASFFLNPSETKTNKIMQEQCKIQKNKIKFKYEIKNWADLWHQTVNKWDQSRGEEREKTLIINVLFLAVCRVLMKLCAEPSSARDSVGPLWLWWTHSPLISGWFGRGEQQHGHTNQTAAASCIIIC